MDEDPKKTDTPGGDTWTPNAQPGATPADPSATPTADPGAAPMPDTVPDEKKKEDETPGPDAGVTP
jgi:hypothetical protein